MAIPEAQLETWSHQGSTVQSASTYATLKRVLEDPRAPYSNRNFEIFLQGSYGNDTNIYSDSDVDIVICLNSTYYSDLSFLSDEDRSIYNNNRSPASYTINQFKQEVTAWLKENFGQRVSPGNKAIYVPGNESRRDSDVLACAEHRRYNSFKSLNNNSFNRGIVFWTSNGTEIVNFPKQHSTNCTTKHQNTYNWFKRNVRCLKNMRNAMIQKGHWEEGRAPSYFLEGMLWNVPNALFSQSFQQCFQNYMGWLASCDSTKLTCANELHWLLRDGQPVCWNGKDFREFLAAAQRNWQSWPG